MSSYPAGTVLLNGYIDVPAERRAEIEAALPVHIELTRAEAGCLFFKVEPSTEVAGRYTVSEAFVDQAAFDAHQQRAGASDWAKASHGIPRDYEIATIK